MRTRRDGSTIWTHLRVPNTPEGLSFIRQLVAIQKELRVLQTKYKRKLHF